MIGDLENKLQKMLDRLIKESKKKHYCLYEIYMIASNTANGVR